ncbi:MAG: delta-60 repeat domain-containing protein [Candidatus Binatia bacterium]
MLQPDGRILLGGSIRLIGSGTDSRFVRILADGTFDPTFAPPNGAGTGGVVQPDGKIITSDFSFGVGSIVRLEASGARDATFVRNFTSTTFASPFALLPDGRVLIIGDFFLPSGRQAGIARLRPTATSIPTSMRASLPTGSSGRRCARTTARSSSPVRSPP